MTHEGCNSSFVIALMKHHVELRLKGKRRIGGGGL